MFFLTTKDVAKILGQTTRNVAYLVKTGKLKNVAPESSSFFLFDKKEVELMQSKKNAHISANKNNNICVDSSHSDEQSIL